MTRAQNDTQIENMAYGFVYDAHARRPMRRLGRVVLRKSENFPQSLAAQSGPGRLAAHVAGLGAAIHPDHHAQGAFLIEPVKQDDDSWLRGRRNWVRALRVRLFAEAGREGITPYPDDPQSEAMLFEARDWAEGASVYLPYLSEALCAQRWSHEEYICGARRDHPPSLPVDFDEAAMLRAAAMIADAVLAGRGLALDARVCPDLASFLAAAGAACDMLPQRKRAQTTFAVGLSLPPVGAISWTQTHAPYAQGSETADMGADEAAYELNDALLQGRWRDERLRAQAGATLFADLRSSRAAAALRSLSDKLGLIQLLAQTLDQPDAAVSREDVSKGLAALQAQGKQEAEIAWTLGLQLAPRGAQAPSFARPSRPKAVVGEAPQAASETRYTDVVRRRRDAHDAPNLDVAGFRF